MTENVDNLLLWYNATPDHIREHASKWYEFASYLIDEIAIRYDIPFKTACALTAVFSPQLDWKYNLVEVEYFLKHNRGWKQTGANVHKAQQILEGKMEYLRGDKVNRFYLNLTGDYQPVTVDVHAWRAWYGFDMVVKNTGITSKQYGVIESDYQTAAGIAGLEPAKFQSVVWTQIRRIKYGYNGDRRF